MVLNLAHWPYKYQKNKKNTQTNCFLLYLFQQKFKSLLISELGKVFPEEMSKYKAIHGEDAPS